MTLETMTWEKEDYVCVCFFVSWGTDVVGDDGCNNGVDEKIIMTMIMGE